MYAAACGGIGIKSHIAASVGSVCGNYHAFAYIFSAEHRTRSKIHNYTDILSRKILRFIPFCYSRKYGSLFFSVEYFYKKELFALFYRLAREYLSNAKFYSSKDISGSWSVISTVFSSFFSSLTVTPAAAIASAFCLFSISSSSESSFAASIRGNMFSPL